MIQKISFSSTFRIPFVEQNMTSNKKEALAKFASQYPNHLYPKNRLGFARISVPEEQDKEIQRGLKEIGVRVYQKFNEHNLPVNKIDKYIKNQLRIGEYSQVGKNKKRISPIVKRELAFLREKNILEKAENGISVADIAKVTGFGENRIRRILDRYNIKTVKAVG